MLIDSRKRGRADEEGEGDEEESITPPPRSKKRRAPITRPSSDPTQAKLLFDSDLSSLGDLSEWYAKLI